ncbi:MAG: carboxymuconolactone decarboxylase family protein [Cellvibrionaceae bacterium]
MFKAVNPEQVTGPTAEAFDEAKSQFGSVINLFRVAGNAPNVLKGILAFNKEVASSCELSNQQVELVAMLTSALNHCDYCVNVHMQVGKMYGLTEQQLLGAMAGSASNTGDQALLDFTDEVVRKRGRVAEKVLKAALDAGFSKKALLEVIGIVGIYTSLQYIRHVANPENDFPVVEQFESSKFGA